MKINDKIIHTLNLNYGFKYYPEDKYLIKQILKPFQNKNLRVLDVGCGTGHYSFLFEKNGMNVTGFDIDKALIEKANEKKKELKSNVTFLALDGRFPEKHFNEKFDIIFMSGFPTFGIDMDKKIMNEYLSLLGSGGKLVYVHSSDLTGLFSNTNRKNPKIGNLKLFFESFNCNVKEIYFYDRHIILKILHSLVFNDYSTKIHILITKITKLPCSLVFIVEKSDYAAKSQTY